MMEFTLSKSSWHYWVANFGEKRVRPRYGEGADICSYIRCFLRGGMLLLGALLFAALIGAWVGYAFFDLGAFIFGYHDKLIPPTIMFFGLFIVLSVTVGVIALWELWKQRPRKEQPPKPPSFVELAWTKVHDKTCAKLNFKD